MVVKTELPTGSVFQKNNSTVAKDSWNSERKVLTEAEKELQTSLGDQYIFYYDMPFFWNNNLYIAAKLAEKFRANKPKGYTVQNVDLVDDGKRVAIYVRVTENSPTVIAIAAGLTLIAISITVIFTLSKVEKVIDKPATIAAATALPFIGIALALGAGVFALKQFKS